MSKNRSSAYSVQPQKEESEHPKHPKTCAKKIILNLPRYMYFHNRENRNKKKNNNNNNYCTFTVYRVHNQFTIFCRNAKWTQLYFPRQILRNKQSHWIKETLTLPYLNPAGSSGSMPTKPDTVHYTPYYMHSIRKITMCVCVHYCYKVYYVI